MVWRVGPVGVLVSAAMLSLATAAWRDDPAPGDALAMAGSTPRGALAGQPAPARASGREPLAGEMRLAGAGQRARTGSRKAVPVTRGQELGLRFRPDERDAYYGAPTFPPDPGRQPSFGADDPQFRPIPRRRKPTYEELQADEARSRPPAAMPTPTLPGLPPTLPPPPAGVFR